MSTPRISRRAFLAATAVAVAARPAAAGAAATPAPHHPVRPARPAARPDLTAQQGNASVTASVTPVQDVAAIDYTITNVGVLPDTFTVSVTDLNNGRESKQRSYELDPGESASDEVYGRLKHSFQLNVCQQSDGTCFTVGPVGPAGQVAGPARGLTARPNQAGPKPKP
jgi:hypothetical protein